MKENNNNQYHKKRLKWTAVNILAAAAALGGGWVWGRFLGLFCGLLLLFALSFLLGAMVYNKALRRNKKALLIPFDFEGELPPDTPRWWVRARQGMDVFQKETVADVFITSHDGLRLHGLFIQGAPGEKRVVVMLHCYHGLGMSMGEYAEYYQKIHGFHILMPDARGHGGSEGASFGMGWIDRLDYLRWIDYVIARMGEDVQILLHGVSMGGATVMMLSGEPLPRQVRFGVEDCGYTEVYKLFRWQFGHLHHYPLFPAFYTFNVLCRLRAGFWFQQASAIKQLKKAKIPLIFVHGEDDSFVPSAMVHDAFAAAASKDKTLISIPGAEHIESFEKDKENRIVHAVEDYIKKYMPAMAEDTGE
ncbi:MAG: alpha/beta fold hydrolase [Oscillospiraceae bacterium]|jgi:fermentation-respiration switch protein FrsA (DUF1100 family)|nr:alpha/beta fold hydrolase [Oscillospiraceae bacterium]